MNHDSFFLCSAAHAQHKQASYSYSLPDAVSVCVSLHPLSRVHWWVTQAESHAWWGGVAVSFHTIIFTASVEARAVCWARIPACLRSSPLLLATPDSWPLSLWVYWMCYSHLPHVGVTLSYLCQFTATVVLQCKIYGHCIVTEHTWAAVGHGKGTSCL